MAMIDVVEAGHLLFLLSYRMLLEADERKGQLTYNVHHPRNEIEREKHHPC